MEINTDNGMQKQQTYTFDFFNYAGIHRSVHLYRTPQIHIQDVAVETLTDANGSGILKYTITTNAQEADEVRVLVTIFDRNGTRVATGEGESNSTNSLSVPNVNLWWPYLMHPDPGYMYQLQIRLVSPVDPNVDTYRMKFGFRTLSWNAKEMLINDKPIYFRGFGRHEDSDVGCSLYSNNVFGS